MNIFKSLIIIDETRGVLLKKNGKFKESAIILTQCIVIFILSSFMKQQLFK